MGQEQTPQLQPQPAPASTPLLSSQPNPSPPSLPQPAPPPPPVSQPAPQPLPDSQNEPTAFPALLQPSLLLFPPPPFVAQPAPGGPYAYPPPPSTCRPYSSLQMLASVADGNGGGVATVNNPGHPQVTTASGFPGMSTLIQRSNQSHLDHAGSSLPKKDKPKRRGKAILLPSLAGEKAKPSIGDCVFEANGGEQVVNLDVSVYPPLPTRADQQEFALPNHIVHYSRNEDSFRTVLSALNLFHQFPNLPVTTQIVDIFRTIIARVQVQYNLSDASSHPLPFHKRLPIQLLCFTNCGAPMSERTNLVDLLNNPYDFAVPRWALTRENHFHVFASNSLTRVYALFRHDVDSVDISELDEEALEQSQECVSMVEDETEETVVVTQLLPGNIQPAPPTPPTPSTHASATPPPVSPTPPSSPSTISSLILMIPSDEKLWEKQWMIPNRLDAIPEFFNSERASSIFETVQANHIQNRRVGCPGIDIEGSSDAELIQRFESIMKDAIN
ncbi:hypothetical protein BDP27DRAFT_1422838 [Rhodocollybia butyracea]|uniref:Uncharacterized protein n=1 Tax=Rhodocollybia butyracea TaxID=206335 RepID=A0A9P5U5X7_9AGAR|nr:hypothetical protein BDP27DRAFT_1422838 [Rhodocollybia butyracea]